MQITAGLNHNSQGSPAKAVPKLALEARSNSEQLFLAELYAILTRGGRVTITPRYPTASTVVSEFAFEGHEADVETAATEASK